MKKTKFKEILSGIMTAIALWLCGFLLAGRLSFVEDLELYPTGPLVFVFPFVIAAACVFIMKYSLKKDRILYFKSFAVSFFAPLLFFFVIMLLSLITPESNPILYRVADVLTAVLIVFTIAPTSIMYQMFSIVPSDTEAVRWLIISALTLVPVIAGLIYSFVLYKKHTQKKAY